MNRSEKAGYGQTNQKNYVLLYKGPSAPRTQRNLRRQRTIAPRCVSRDVKDERTQGPGGCASRLKRGRISDSKFSKLTGELLLRIKARGSPPTASLLRCHLVLRHAEASRLSVANTKRPITRRLRPDPSARGRPAAAGGPGEYPPPAGKGLAGPERPLGPGAAPVSLPLYLPASGEHFRRVEAILSASSVPRARGERGAPAAGATGHSRRPEDALPGLSGGARYFLASVSLPPPPLGLSRGQQGRKETFVPYISCHAVRCYCGYVPL
ncbi:PREDICTED: uncharacterized protein LOC105506815 [Colobus angolensis palliatus]|uniref:uncharacterized protein LOC105506815 n=1 Tax=Colobus angolensis palliatus TaxID=336983 RepID=UPI0005F47861|nr:PREDICTED: uncharacterized protein LOC105506815 [Colobus angolensis palliatus]